MTWEWSHTPEALEAARVNLHNLPHLELVEIYAEWQANKPGGFSQWHYARALKPAALIRYDTLADAIWYKMEQLRACDTGGHRAHACPFGCHTVSFSDGE